MWQFQMPHESYEPTFLLQIKMVRGLFVIALVLLAAAAVQSLQSQKEWLERRAIDALLHLEGADAQAQAAVRAYEEAHAEAHAEANARTQATAAAYQPYRRQTNIRVLLAQR
ncbi:uncharacterized protein LOC134805002 [Cydia splendana]|uniref:uncharacterized protein LOC134805002 n=1 Tax=Cydia splendana TaxID=1100963 RepID=UPI0028F4951A